MNIKLADDFLRNQQNFNTIYSDGKNIFENNIGEERSLLQQYNYSGSKSTSKESIYFNTSLTNRHQKYILNTESNKSLNSHQVLNNSKLSWQLNFSYIKKLKSDVLWTNTFGYFDQTLQEVLQTEPDLLFWLFPDQLSLNRLQSKGNIRFQYGKYRTSFIIDKKRMSHQIDMGFTYDKKTFESAVNFLRLSDDSSGNPFSNKTPYQLGLLTIGYTGKLFLSASKSLTIKLINEPADIKYSFIGNSASKRNYLLYDYSGGISSKVRGGAWNATIGFKNQLAESNLLFTDFMQNGFHSLRSGFEKPFNSRSIYTQLFFNSISLKRQMISFFMVNVSHNHDDFIRSMKSTGIATITAYPFYPNNTNSLITLFRTQKVFGTFPISFQPKVLYNVRSIVYSYDDQITRSNIQSVNATLGLKTLFESSFNIDYNFSVLSSVNKVQSPKDFLQAQRQY
ncbi:MAG: hypothetical protein ABIN48_15405 [Ginsengibacter sp.]